MKPIKFFCSECNEKLTMKYIENDKNEERIWLEPCEGCFKKQEKDASKGMIRLAQLSGGVDET